MEVNRDNYLEVFPEVLKKLESASFVSFDAEFTGMTGDEGDENSLFDNTDERYHKLRNVVHCNSAPWVGISIFKREEGPEYAGEQVYTVDAYSFYLEEPFFGDFNMTKPQAFIDIDCVPFLNRIHFNYNKWMYCAMPYLNETMYAELENYLAENPEVLTSPGRKSLSRYKYIKEDDGETEVLLKMRGFSRIVDVIRTRKLPVVGHNMAQDLLYFFQMFCKDLPEDYDEFKREVVNFLPAIYDTKYMTIRCRRSLDHPSLTHVKNNSKNLLCSGLFAIYKSTSSKVDKFSPKFRFSEGCKHFADPLEVGKKKELEDEENSPLCHEPSFDACVTGVVFLNLAHIECKLDKGLLGQDNPPSFPEVVHNVLNWQHQVFLARASVMAMCLVGPDPRPEVKWILVSSSSKEALTCSEVMNKLKSDPNPTTSDLISKIDSLQANPNEIILAVALKIHADELLQRLDDLGYEAVQVKPQWDNERYQNLEKWTPDPIFDTRKGSFLVP